MSRAITKYPEALHRAVRERLLDLAAETAPQRVRCGICADISLSVDFGAPMSVLAYQYCDEIFRGLGLCPVVPLRDNDWQGKWEGANGVARRKLAQDMADYIQHNFLTTNEENS